MDQIQFGLLPTDPFGLWSLGEPLSPGQRAGELVFDAPGGEGGPDGLAPLVWSLSLDGSAGSWAELDRRAAEVRAIEQGLAQAEGRLETLLAAREAAGGQVGSGVAFDLEAGPASLALLRDEPAERELNDTLNRLLAPLPQPGLPPEETSFDIFDDASALFRRVRAKFTRRPEENIPWGELEKQFRDLVDSVNRQVLHYAWVETLLGGRLAARTIVKWTGDMDTCWGRGLLLEQRQAHSRSLELALASRAASVRTLLTVTRLAWKLIIATTTPAGAVLGAVEALSLGAQFVLNVIRPALKRLRQAA